MFDVGERIADEVLEDARGRHGESVFGDVSNGSTQALVPAADSAYRAIARATRALFALLVEIGRSGAWEDDGARDLAHWVQMRYGISAWKAHRWTDAAHAIEYLPYTAQALASGELGVDKVVELTRHGRDRARSARVGDDGVVRRDPSESGSRERASARGCGRPGRGAPSPLVAHR